MSTGPNLPALRDVVASHGLGADKRFGQHFLFDLNLTTKIARLCGDMSGADIIEIGPGPGGLTRALLAEGARRLVAIEKDPRFITALDHLREAYRERFTAIEADALSADEAELARAAGSAGPFIIASNLPYNVGTPLVLKWLQAEPVWWRRAVLMFQKEVAERIVAEPGSSAYGRLAVMAQSRAACRLAFTLPARAFTPPPKVDSAVVVLEPLPEDARFKDVHALEIVTASAFGQRRKTLRRSLAQAASQTASTADALLHAAGLDPGARAETISIKGFQALASAWRTARS
ncbi:MAG: 16S rRNA (adenine(1518)-N(6)/adenine(1519)-N(6))-dimethyltransferase RsmA [Pseudomonadota bacterium]